jgi:hypothetical protein
MRGRGGRGRVGHDVISVSGPHRAAPCPKLRPVPADPPDRRLTAS